MTKDKQTLSLTTIYLPKLAKNIYWRTKMRFFKSTLLSVTLFTAANSGLAIAEDNWVDVYGKIMLTLDKVAEDNGAAPGLDVDQWELNSNASRFGVKGSGDSGVEGLEVFYKMEWAVDITDEGKQKNFTSRNQYVGLRGGYGEILAGRSDTPTKSLVSKIDLFNDYQMEFKHTFNGEKRVNNIIQYTNAKMGGFKGKIALVPGEGSAQADGISMAVEYKTGYFTLGASYDDGIEGENIETTRALVKFNNHDWQVGFMFQDTDNNGISGDGMVLSARYKMDKHYLKLQLVESDVWQAGVSSKVKYASQKILGWDYNASKKTTFVSYLSLSDVGETGDDDTVVGIGIVQKF